MTEPFAWAGPSRALLSIDEIARAALASAMYPPRGAVWLRDGAGVIVGVITNVLA